MRKVRVKICGITRLEDIYICVRAGADALGFIVDVPSSPRNISLDRAKQLIKATPPFVTRTVVTVFKNAEQVFKIHSELKPDIIQLHGNPPSAEVFQEIFERIRVIGAINISQNTPLDEILRLINSFDAVLVDSHVSGMYGGTGVAHDWSVSRRIRDMIYPKPLILAGGLKPENVRSAILMVKPFAVDVSSGVEAQPGIKDENKVVSFIEEVRRAEECLN
ncbi:MAG: phosphoribosylanthranilate isomerase [Candidatus Bathyarchaeota archaeon]|nr:phosphoribosylanthranilate isomerase [Candidatus Bathyarchaeota archaeon]